MKVIASSEMARIEKLAIEAGASPTAMMQAAGRAIARRADTIIRERKLDRTIVLICGKGNNAGDTYVAGCYLLEMGYSVVAYHLENPDNCSHLCKTQLQHFITAKGLVYNPSIKSDFIFPKSGLIIDGIFGTGFHGSVSSLIGSAILAANESGLFILSVDIPSGLNGETGEISGPVIKPIETLFLGLPKTGFFIRDGWNSVGKLVEVNFGLLPKWVDLAKEDFIMLSLDIARMIKLPIMRNRQKYERGVVVGLAGSPGMPGAAQLSSLAALRCGAGIVRLLHPDGMQKELSNTPYEIIRIAYSLSDPKAVIDAIRNANACFVGPGLGRSPAVVALLKMVLDEAAAPLVLDADALTLIAEHKLIIPKKSILTPHHGELLRLLNRKDQGKQPITLEWINECQKFCEERQVTLVVKGSPTFICHPKDRVLVNPTGDPGMATAGSGDVLTGMIGALLGQGMQPRDAAALGVFIHGLSGECAAQAKSSDCLIASDIIEYLPAAFKQI